MCFLPDQIALYIMWLEKKELPLQFGKGTPYPFGWSGVVLMRSGVDAAGVSRDEKTENKNI
jgi:hypothetical protein